LWAFGRLSKTYSFITFGVGEDEEKREKTKTEREKMEMEMEMEMETESEKMKTERQKSNKPGDQEHLYYPLRLCGCEMKVEMCPTTANTYKGQMRCTQPRSRPFGRVCQEMHRRPTRMVV
jgi:hypothetical protein